MESGAGSVAVSARPALPRTCSTSGNWTRMRSVSCRSFCACSIETPGIVLGMYSNAPSSTCGMNSEPMIQNNGMVRTTRRTAPPITCFFQRRLQRTSGS